MSDDLMSSDAVLVRELKEWLETPQRDGGGIVAAEGLIRRAISVLSAFGGANLRAYRQARVFEPSMDGYYGAMATYAAAFGKPDGEIGVLTTDGEKQPWELSGSAAHFTPPPAVAGAVPAPQWQPIETKPEDVEHIIAAFRDGRHVETGEALLMDGNWLYLLTDCYVQPTHWMPLPKGPTDDK